MKGEPSRGQWPTPSPGWISNHCHSFGVPQGACRNYRNARSRWLNKKLKASRPLFHKKNRTGTGSFLAASGVKLIQYDGHRRIRLPYLGQRQDDPLYP